MSTGLAGGDVSVWSTESGLFFLNHFWLMDSEFGFEFTIALTLWVVIQLSVYVFGFGFFFPRDSVTVAGVWFGNRIY